MGRQTRRADEETDGGKYMRKQKEERGGAYRETEVGGDR